MHPTHSVQVVRSIPASAQAVWERIADHAQTHTWVLAARVRLLSPGEPSPNGVGAVREVSFPGRPLWSTIKERVTAFSPPTTFSYTIISGLPGMRDHLGTLTVTAIDDSHSTLTWHVDFEFARWHPMGWIAGPFTRTFGKVLDAALGELERQLSKPRSGGDAHLHAAKDHPGTT